METINGLINAIKTAVNIWVFKTTRKEVVVIQHDNDSCEIIIDGKYIVIVKKLKE